MRIAVVQASPIFLDTPATTEIVLRKMRDASANGAELCVFPETFLPGYPTWHMITTQLSEAQREEAHGLYVEAAISKDGPELAAIAALAKELGLFTYIGCAERSASGGTAYCSLAAVHPTNGVVSLHRKLKPTATERTTWGDGDGAGLKVHDWKDFKVGGLNCFENWMPLARYALYEQGEQLHVSVWPGWSKHTEVLPKFVAVEGRVYFAAAVGLLNYAAIPDKFPLKEQLKAIAPLWNGGSIIVGPDGETLAGPVVDQETILYADIDAKKVREARFRFDVAGHYGRPDVFQLDVNRKRMA